MSFSTCKAKRAEHARPHTENEWFGRWPVRPSEAETLGVGFQKKIPGFNGLTVGTKNVLTVAEYKTYLSTNSRICATSDKFTETCIVTSQIFFTLLL